VGGENQKQRKRNRSDSTGFVHENRGNGEDKDFARPKNGKKLIIKEKKEGYNLGLCSKIRVTEKRETHLNGARFLLKIL